ncbi:hypothetical protein, conserved [Babesia bigemina]|uniref:WD domain, G-beta repeat containing protein n=1 Tax=Babesia bigemina TaxID=5866 RepID=A0A061DA41_BABBI|nr:hypothetical protein, conserved [Babesia bigemina]CDR97398.1 hypothetical protein, conserved [Babesia bigemina]|eukprot:XP_012769584.1 hypothetical protein, conserved [Babesia bigemina]
MEKYNVGVQTRCDSGEKEPTFDDLQRRLCRLITDRCGRSSDEVDIQRIMGSTLFYSETIEMKTDCTPQTTYLPKDPVTSMRVKSESTYAVAMRYGEGKARDAGIGKVYLVDIESRVPSVKMCCLGGVTKLAFANHDGMLFGGSLNGSIHAWDTNSMVEVESILPSNDQGHVDPIVALELLDDDTLLSADAAGRAFTWSLRNLSEPLSRLPWETLRGTSRVSKTCRGSVLYCGTLDGHVYGCCVSGEPSESHRIHDNIVTAMATSSNDSTGSQPPLSATSVAELLATGSFDCYLKVWDAQNLGEPLHELVPAFHAITDLSWYVPAATPICHTRNPALSEVLASVDESGNVFTWSFSINNQMPVCMATVEETCTCVEWTPSGRLLIVGGNGVTVFEPSVDVLSPDPDAPESAFVALRSTRSFAGPMSKMLS